MQRVTSPNLFQGGEDLDHSVRSLLMGQSPDTRRTISSSAILNFFLSVPYSVTEKLLGIDAVWDVDYPISRDSDFFALHRQVGSPR